MSDYIKAHKFSSNHMQNLKKDNICGCFYCLSIFSPKEIKEWIIANNDCDKVQLYALTVKLIQLSEKAQDFLSQKTS